MPNWTLEQRAAIETKNCNLLVAAAAGSGKTAVLVQRIIEKITGETPCDIDKLLVVTFTNAAASEMKERIGDALSRERDKNPSSKNLQRQLSLLNKASITTIHSFCLNVIKNNFHLIDLDPDFKISDEAESVLLKQEALDELFDEMYKDERITADFLKLVDSYGGKRDDSGVKEMVLNLYDFSRSLPEPNKWLMDSSEAFNIDDKFDFGDTVWAKVLFKSIEIELSGYRTDYEAAVEIIKGDKGLYPYLDCYLMELQRINDLLKFEGSWDEYAKEFEGILSIFGRIPSAKKDADPINKDKVKAVRDSLKKRLRELYEGAFSSDNGKIREDFNYLYPLMKVLTELTIEFGEIYKEMKRDRGIIDFNDIEHFAIEILTIKDGNGFKASPAAVELKERYEEILIDEYQDSNMVQELILSTVSRCDKGENNIFMVGDVKQSIYRFRQAKPELFLQKYNSYSADNGNERKITLFKNFRSRKDVIDAVNLIFGFVMSESVGELEYDEGERLNFGSLMPSIEGAGGPVDVYLIDKSEEPSEDEDGINEIDEPDKIQLEAYFVGNKIKEMMKGDFNVYDNENKSFRPLEFKDIVILLRATMNWAPVFLEELTAMGIPVFADTQSGYFDAIEVNTFISLLKIIDNPIQDIPLLSVLNSPIGGFTPEELIEIRGIDREIPFYEALRRKSIEGDSKALEFLNKLEVYRKKSYELSVSDFIWFLYDETGYMTYVSAMPGGVQRKANLRLLFERAREYEKTSYRGLFNFINFIDKLKAHSGDMGSAKTIGENENVVRLMSIHKSKGLEYPVVFLSGAGKKFNFADLNRGILFHHELGLGPELIDLEKRITYSTAVKNSIKVKLKLETLSEEMRVLYVGMTRAKEKLIITGSVKNLDKSIDKWGGFSTDKLPGSYVMNTSCYLDLICPPVLSCKDSYFNLQRVKKSEILKELGDIENEDLSLIEDIRNIDKNKDYSKYKDEIDRRLSYNYPHERASLIPQVLSVSEAKKIAEFDEEIGRVYDAPNLLKMPTFMQDKRVPSPAQRGTLMHLMMEKLDLSRVGRLEEIEEQLEGLIFKKFVSRQEASFINTKKIFNFFKSNLGRRMVSAGEIKREVSFSMFIDPLKLYELKGENIDEKILIRGVIDCYFIEDGEIVLIDYKTDIEDDENVILERYKGQLTYYKEALLRMTGVKIKESYLYLFHSERAILV